MKKIILGIGSVAAVAAPIMSVVSCKEPTLEQHAEWKATPFPVNKHISGRMVEAALSADATTPKANFEDITGGYMKFSEGSTHVEFEIRAKVTRDGNIKILTGEDIPLTVNQIVKIRFSAPSDDSNQDYIPNKVIIILPNNKSIEVDIATPSSPMGALVHEALLAGKPEVSEVSSGPHTEVSSGIDEHGNHYVETVTTGNLSPEGFGH